MAAALIASATLCNDALCESAWASPQRTCSLPASSSTSWHLRESQRIFFALRATNDLGMWSAFWQRRQVTLRQVSLPQRKSCDASEALNHVVLATTRQRRGWQRRRANSERTFSSGFSMTMPKSQCLDGQPSPIA